MFLLPLSFFLHTKLNYIIDSITQTFSPEKLFEFDQLFLSCLFFPRQQQSKILMKSGSLMMKVKEQKLWGTFDN